MINIEVFNLKFNNFNLRKKCLFLFFLIFKTNHMQSGMIKIDHHCYVSVMYVCLTHHVKNVEI